jgi:hypothetical protein
MVLESQLKSFHGCHVGKMESYIVHDIHTKFHENPTAGSKVIWGVNM